MEWLGKNSVFKIAEQYGVDLTEAADLIPRLAELDADGKVVQEITGPGVAYTFFQIDYCEGRDVRLSRMVAAIAPGNRTEVAYWTMVAPEKYLTTHRG